MAKNTEKRISVNAFERVMADRFTQTEVIDWNGLKVTIRHYLSLADAIAFVNHVTESAFDKDGAYVPETFDFAIRLNILCRYANFALPQSVEKKYDFVYGTDAVGTIMQHIDTKQLDVIVHACENKIRYLCDTNTSAVQQELAKVIGALDDLQESAADVMKDVDPKLLSSLTAAIAKGGALDEGALASAVLEKKYGVEKKASTDA